MEINDEVFGPCRLLLLGSSKAAPIKAGFPQYESQLKASYVHQELFHRRSRIMHWGEVNYRQEDALLALNAAFSAFAFLK
jgi:hypothetical protein